MSELNIPWEEQPTLKSLAIIEVETGRFYWVEEFSDYYGEVAGSHVFDKAWIQKDCYEIHRRPEPEFKQGGWFISSGGAEMAFIGIDSGNAYVCEIQGGGLTRLYDFAGCKKKETERDKFIGRLDAYEIDEIRANEMWNAGFRYTGDKE